MDDKAGNPNRSGGTIANNVYLDTTKADKAVWLMKCPPLVSRSLRSPPSDAADASRPVAKVVVSLDPLNCNDDSSPQFTMELAGTEAGHIPRCYAMDMSKDFIPMSVFSESSQGKISVEGKILNKFDMKPHNQNLELYGKLCRERTNKYMVKSRQIQVIDNDHGAHMRPMPGMITFATSGASEKKKTPTKATETKRTRRDRGEMEEILFKLFERKPNWSLKQLIQETDQPEQYVKDILKELCVYNNKGTNQGTYELKPEYRRSHD
ncbi:general transcription factor IIF subunit 2 isoform X1 [Neltuma alba]|uniref:general transcription factor IIF subunit 2 isoform X1 n=1 Tax=Neltuma alba TaxID=207710 RepID=UPI0010A54598|nr:general transcription factor IIF subunit 2 isoform X1 [Prosopis alba]